MIKEVIKPKVIIQPKSMIGLISLKIRDKKAKTVVKTVYIIGQNILLVVREIISKPYSYLDNLFLTEENECSYEYSLPSLKSTSMQ